MAILLLTKEARTYNGENIASSISGARKTGHLHVRERNWNTASNHTQK